jgi:hypothetical protein
MEIITLEYQPFSLLKYTRKIKGEFPSAFEEIKPSQLLAITGLINSTISETDFLKIMTGIPESVINKIEEIQRYELMNLFEPFTDIKPYHAFKIPHIKTGNGNIISPKSKLAGMTFAQFIFIESYFTSYQFDKNEIDLHKFVASLYLPQNQYFNENEITAFALSLKNIKSEIPDAIVINYVLVKEWLALAYPLVFQREEENEEVSKSKKHNQQSNNSGWLKIYESIVGDDLINHDRYGLIPLHNVLRWMTKKIKAPSGYPKGE